MAFDRLVKLLVVLAVFLLIFYLVLVSYAAESQMKAADDAAEQGALGAQAQRKTVEQNIGKMSTQF